MSALNDGPFFAAFPIVATKASGVPAATPQAPATTLTEIVEVKFLASKKVTIEKEIANKMR